MANALLDSVKVNVNVPGLFNDILDKVLDPALQKLVDDTANPLDNILKAAIAPALESLLKGLAKTEWDKLVGGA